MKKIISYLVSAVLLYFVIKFLLKTIGGIVGVLFSLVGLAVALYLLKKFNEV